MNASSNCPELITNKDEYNLLAKQCAQVIINQKRLPDFVFRIPFQKYFVIEYANIYRKEFGKFLSSIGTTFGDSRINYMTIKPDPVDYYYKHNSFYGVASFKTSEIADRYVPVMSRSGEIDSFYLRGGDVGTFWGSSLKWGMFCDRISWETIIIGLSETKKLPVINEFRCMDTISFSTYIKSHYSNDQSIASNFIKQFLANYSF